MESLKYMRTVKKPLSENLSFLQTCWITIKSLDKLAVTIGVFVFLILLVFVSGADLHMQGRPEEEPFKAPIVRVYAACAIGVTLPLVVDTALDLVFCPGAGYIGLRFVSTSSLVIYSLITILTTPYSTFVQIQYIFSFCQIFIEISLGLWLMYDIDKRKVWTLNRCVVILSSYGLYILMGCIQRITETIDVPSISACRLLLQFIPYAAFIFFSIVWLRSFFIEMNSKIRSLRDNKKPIVYFDLIQTSDYLLIVLTIVGLIVIPSYAFWSYVLGYFQGKSSEDAGLTAEWLAGVFVIRCFMTFFTCILPGRIFKQKAIEDAYDNEVKTSFVKYLSHEMRTPMNVMAMGLDLVVTQLERKVALQEVLQTVSESRTACSEVIEILDNLLLYERLENSRLSIITTQEESFLDLMVSSLTPLPTFTQGKSVDLDVLDPTRQSLDQLADIKICAEKSLFHALMRVIVSKSVRDAGPESIIRVGVEIKDRVRHSRVKSITSLTLGGTGKVHADMTTTENIIRIVIPLSVELTQEEKDLYLSESLKFKREAKYGSGGGGSALSVWITKTVVARHGGSIGFSADDSTSALCIDIPFTRGVVDEDAAAKIQKFRESVQAVATVAHSVMPFKPQRSLLFEKRKLKLLVVDDSDLNRKMIVKVMTSLGHTCTEANDGSVAVSIMEEAMESRGLSCFDAVLLDNEMPIMRGRDAVRRMRDIGYTGIVLGVTGNALQEDLEDFEQSGANKVILKPMTTHKFEEVMTGLWSK